MQHYNQPTPPIYDLTKIDPKLPIVMFSGESDSIADPTDVALLVAQLPPSSTHTVIPEYTHVRFFDFLTIFCVRWILFGELMLIKLYIQPLFKFCNKLTCKSVRQF